MRVALSRSSNVSGLLQLLYSTYLRRQGRVAMTTIEIRVIELSP